MSWTDETSDLGMVMCNRVGLVILLIGAAACARRDSAVLAFDSQLAATNTAITEAAAASYIYRLSETPEEQAMQEAMKRIAARRASRADMQTALETERARRARYIDELDTSIDQARTVVATLSRNANAIHDSEVRNAALKIVTHHEEQLRLCSVIANAQRKRSAATESFLETLLEKKPLRADDRLAIADADGEKARRRLEEIASADELLVAEFRGVKERRDRASLW